MPRVKVKRKCSNCGVPGHQKRTCKEPVILGNMEVLKGAKPPANGQPNMDTMKEHGRKYLELEREILLRQVDQLDAALKLMS